MQVAWSVPVLLGATSEDGSTVTKSNKQYKRSDSVWRPQFVQRVQDIDANTVMSMKATARDLDVFEDPFRKVVNEDIRYNSYVVKKRQFVIAHT